VFVINYRLSIEPEFEMKLPGIALFILMLLSAQGLPVYAGEGPNSGEDRERPKIGLALSGGGARGSAHVGVIKALEELGVPIDYIAGTSMGAIIGGIYAAGYSADELEQVLADMNWSGALSDKLPRREQSMRKKDLDAQSFPFAPLQQTSSPGRKLFYRVAVCRTHCVPACPCQAHSHPFN